MRRLQHQTRQQFYLQRRPEEKSADEDRHEQHMSALKGQKLECFAREVASMMPMDRAYIAAGFKPLLLSWHDGNALALCPAVAARIEELRDEFRERALAHAEYLQRRRFRQRQEKSDHA